jgi:uncharacterized protein (DUF362 family)/ferredoxin
VLIKPNLLMKRRPDEGTTTHPALIRAVIRHLQELGVSRITVADSPGGVYSKQTLSAIYKACGIEAVCKETGVILNYDTASAPMHNPAGKLCKTFEIIQPVHDADCIISVGKLKTHCMTGLSGGVKNLFGCIPGLMKPEFHWRYPEETRFCEMLIDLCETVRPSITLIDAVVSMEGDGPSSGSLRETGLTFCADSPYELDLVLAKVIGKNPDDLWTIQHAISRGLSPRSAEEVQLLGDPLPIFPDFKQPRSRGVDFMAWVPKPLRPVTRPIVEKFLTPRPEIQRKKCVGCGKCAESCPTHTIVISEGKASIRRENCIKCYCCHEMCPVHAIRVKRSHILDL